MEQPNDAKLGIVVGVIAPDGSQHVALVQRVWDALAAYLSPTNQPGLNVVRVHDDPKSEDVPIPGCGSFGAALIRDTSILHFSHPGSLLALRCWFFASEEADAVAAMTAAREAANPEATKATKAAADKAAKEAKEAADRKAVLDAQAAAQNPGAGTEPPTPPADGDGNPDDGPDEPDQIAAFKALLVQGVADADARLQVWPDGMTPAEKGKATKAAKEVAAAAPPAPPAQ